MVASTTSRQSAVPKKGQRLDHLQAPGDSPVSEARPGAPKIWSVHPRSERECGLDEEAPCCYAAGTGKDSARQACRLTKSGAGSVESGCGIQCWNQGSCRRAIVDVVEDVQRLSAEGQSIFVAGVVHSTKSPGSAAKSTAAAATTTAANPPPNPGPPPQGRAAWSRRCRASLRSEAEGTADAEVHSYRCRAAAHIDRDKGLASLRNRIECAEAGLDNIRGVRGRACIGRTVVKKVVAGEIVGGCDVVRVCPPEQSRRG